jgi:F-type H+-transporting ATPase subunit b
MASETNTAASEHAQGMPQLDFATFPNQIFWLVVTLLIIYFVLSKVALPRIASVIAERQGAIAGDLAMADELKQKAVDAEEAYNKALADARSEAQAIIAEAKADIQKELDVAIAHADAEISAKAAESEGAITEIRKGAQKSIQDVATETAKAVAQAVMPGVGDAASIKKAVTNRMKG